MKAPAFSYVLARDLDEASATLQADEDARVLAGGQSLVALMNLRLARPSVLVDLNGLGSLDFVTPGEGSVELGAMCRHRRLASDAVVASETPLLAHTARLIGHPQVRNRGTLGGSLAHGDPAAELPAALVALDGRIVLHGPGGDRTVAAPDFFSGYFSTAIGPGEVLRSVVVPRSAPGDGYAFAEFAPRHGDFAVVGVGVWIGLGRDGRCQRARAAACGVAPTPCDLSAALSGLLGEHEPGDTALRDAAARVAELVEPPGDIHASSADRGELAQLLLIEATRHGFSRAKAGGS